METKLRDLLAGLRLPETLAYAVLGGKVRAGAELSRVRIVPRMIGGELRFQAEEQRGKKAYHANIAPDALADALLGYMDHFRNLSLFTDAADIQVAVGPSGGLRISEGPPTKGRVVTDHDRSKDYILREGRIEPFLVELGVTDAAGRVRRERYGKFRQINRYLEFLRDLMPALPAEGPLRVVDFGSGKAYLTFALYRYLSGAYAGPAEGRDVEVVGLDLKEDVVAFCESVARKLDFQGLCFRQGDVARYEAGADRPHLVVSLHACDTATDEALAAGIAWGCEALMAVPCCQHEFAPLMKNDAMEPLLRHGIAADRLAALVTDSSRVLMLEAFGYQAELVEFIETEHTPKNLLIRAHVRRRAFDPQAYGKYRSFLDTWGIGRSYLEKSLAAKGLLP